jgi:hypothetical protein
MKCKTCWFLIDKKECRCWNFNNGNIRKCEHYLPAFFIRVKFVLTYIRYAFKYRSGRNFWLVAARKQLFSSR